MLLAAASGDAPLGPVWVFFGALVTASVAFLTGWRWPTLRRRVQDHAAIVKDLPEGTGHGLRRLLEDELVEYAARERLWLTIPAIRLFGALGWLATAVLVALVLLALAADATGNASAGHVLWSVFYGVSIVGTLVFIPALGWVAYRLRRGRPRASRTRSDGTVRS